MHKETKEAGTPAWDKAGRSLEIKRAGIPIPNGIFNLRGYAFPLLMKHRLLLRDREAEECSGRAYPLINAHQKNTHKKKKNIAKDTMEEHCSTSACLENENYGSYTQKYQLSI